MRLLRAAFVLLIAVDLISILLAIIWVNPHLVFLSLVISALAKWWYNEIWVKQGISLFYNFKKKNHVKYSNKN